MNLRCKHAHRLVHKLSGTVGQLVAKEHFRHSSRKEQEFTPIDLPSTDWIQNFNKETANFPPTVHIMGLLRSLGFSRRAKIHPAAVIFLACCFLFVVFSSEEESYEDSAAEQAAYSAAVHDAAS